MTLEIGLLLGVLVAAIVLFSFEWFAADITALGILLFLILSGLLPAREAFAGFGSDVVIMILGLLIITAALSRTGVTDLAGRVLGGWTGSGVTVFMVLMMLVAIGTSSFISNTAATAIFLPVVIGIAQRMRVSESRLLMPLAFASILASSITLVGTSTNIIVSGLMTSYGLEPMGMFELTPVGLPIALAGLIYMVTIGQRLIPQRAPVSETVEEYSGVFLSEIEVTPGSPLVGKTLEEAALGENLDLTVLRVVRDKSTTLVPEGTTRLEENDILLVEADRETLLRARDEIAFTVRGSAPLGEAGLQTTDVALTEVILLPGSPLIGRRLKTIRFRDRYGLQVLAINRHGEALTRKLSTIRLRMGDILLVQGDQKRVAALEKQNTLRVLGQVNQERPNWKRARIAAAIFAAAVLAVAFNLLTLPVAMLLGALLVFLTRCITPEEAYREVPWRVLILIACMLGLGAAMEATGAAEFLAQQIVNVFGTANPIWLLSGFFLLTMLLTQPMSNQAAAVVVLPIAIQSALQLGLNPRSFAMMIALGASCSFLTPLEPACLMVFGPGQYRFKDFVKVGSLLTIVIYLICILLVPLLWPLHLP